jgi:hypothetical protein
MRRRLNYDVSSAFLASELKVTPAVSRVVDNPGS